MSFLTCVHGRVILADRLRACGFAAALIDQCGCKGLQVGGAKVSEKHAGFVVNAGGATCKDVLELMEEVKKRVLEATGILLEPEVKVLK